MLRRAAVLALLLPPLGAAAQTAGTMTFNIDGKAATVLGPATCAGTNAFSTSWSFALNGAAVTPASTNLYNVYVSNTAFTSCGSTLGSGTLPSGVALVPSAANISPTTSAAQIFPQTGTVTWASVVAAAAAAASKTACAADGTIYFCAQLLQSSTSSTLVGSATGSIDIQVAKPAAPVQSAPGAGDRTLYLSWTAGTPTTPVPDHFEATATATAVCGVVPANTPCDTATPHQYGSIGSAPFAADNLVNLVPYSVVMRAVSKGGVVSDDSNAVTGTPVPVNDFWGEYALKGRETGGCATGAGGLLALLGAAAALRRARRKS